MRETISAQPSKGPRFLYSNPLGKSIRPLLTARWVSRLAGKFSDSRLSKLRIKKFIKKHNIDMGDYLPENYQSFNAFFTRRIRPELRPFDLDPTAFCSPCDGAVTVFPVTREGTFHVKGFDYTVETLLQNAELAEKYLGGLCIVLRLTVNDYHRYHFSDGGTRGERKFIKGKLHTVQPAALEKKKVFAENCREWTVLHTENFGDIVQVEVGAMFVGRIVNEEKPSFKRGEEKGRFEFGGSTVILFVQEGRVEIEEEFFLNTAAGKETCVKCGEKIGTKMNSQEKVQEYPSFDGKF